MPDTEPQNTSRAHIMRPRRSGQPISERIAQAQAVSTRQRADKPITLSVAPWEKSNEPE